MKSLKDNLNRILKLHGLSLSELAKKAKVPKSNIHSWTTGANPKLDQLKKVSEVLKVPLHELAFGEADPYEALSEEVLKEIFAGDIRVTLHRIERKKSVGGGLKRGHFSRWAGLIGASEGQAIRSAILSN